MRSRGLRTLIGMGIAVVLPVAAQNVHIQSSKGFVTVLRGEGDDAIARGKDAILVTDDRIVSGPDAEAEISVDQANTVLEGGDSEIRLGELYPGRYQIILVKGGLTWNVGQASTAEADVVSPSVTIRPHHQGVYEISLDDVGETVITARVGRIEVAAPGGSAWVSQGQTMVARGPFDNPEFRIVGRGSRWRRMLTLLSNLQVGTVVSSFDSGSAERGKPRPADTHPTHGGNHPVQPPESGHTGQGGHNTASGSSGGHSSPAPSSSSHGK